MSCRFSKVLSLDHTHDALLVRRVFAEKLDNVGLVYDERAGRDIKGYFGERRLVSINLGAVTPQAIGVLVSLLPHLAAASTVCWFLMKANKSNVIISPEHLHAILVCRRDVYTYRQFECRLLVEYLEKTVPTCGQPWPDLDPLFDDRVDNAHPDLIQMEFSPKCCLVMLRYTHSEYARKNLLRLLKHYFEVEIAKHGRSPYDKSPCLHPISIVDMLIFVESWLRASAPEEGAYAILRNAMKQACKMYTPIRASKALELLQGYPEALKHVVRSKGVAPLAELGKLIQENRKYQHLQSAFDEGLAALEAETPDRLRKRKINQL